MENEPSERQSCVLVLCQFGVYQLPSLSVEVWLTLFVSFWGMWNVGMWNVGMWEWLPADSTQCEVKSSLQLVPQNWVHDDGSFSWLQWLSGLLQCVGGLCSFVPYCQESACHQWFAVISTEPRCRGVVCCVTGSSVVDGHRRVFRCWVGLT